MRIMNVYVVSMLFLTVSCTAMNETSDFKKVALTKEYVTDPNNPIPVLLNQERVKDYCHSYEPTPGTKLPRNAHKEYSEQFEKSIIRGGQKTYEILIKKNLQNYNANPKIYLQEMTAVICFLYSKLLDKSAVECGPKQWSLILEDPQELWRNFFINEYNTLTNKLSHSKINYIKSITTSHLKHLDLRTHYGITTNIAPESIVPYVLPNNDDTILVIPYHDKEKNWFFIKTGKNKETGWLKGSVTSLVQGIVSRVRKTGWLEQLTSNDEPTYNKEYVPVTIVKKMNELFPETKPERLLFLHDIRNILKEKELEDFGKEKNEVIKSFIYELERNFDHLDIRLGNEGIFDTDELRSTSLAYSLLEWDEKGSQITITKDYMGYFPIINKLRTLKNLIFLHNHVSKETYCMQTIRNTVDEIIKLKSSLNDKSFDLHVQDYFISVMELLKLILTSKECDIYLCSQPIFEQKYHKPLTEKLMAETSIKPTKPNEFLVLPKDRKEELE